MMSYMCEGGWGMWLILFIAVGTPVIAAVRGPRARAMVFLAGCVGSLIAGMMGMATGLAAVSAHYAQFSDKTEAIGSGLGELSNNGTFSATVALLLGIAALVAHRKAPAAA
jgi:hypothetical protein